MNTQYANMVGSICLDKAILPEYEKRADGKGTPITFEIWQVYNGSFFPGHNSRDRMFSGNFRSIQEAQHAVHMLFLEWLEEDRLSKSSFWLENYQSARSKPESWIKQGKTGFGYDNYAVLITTSNRDIVSL